MRLVLLLSSCLCVAAAHAAPVTYSIETYGFTDAEHTRTTDGYRASSAGAIVSQDGTTLLSVVGTSKRYGAGGSDGGTTAWFANGQTLTKLGFTDAEHTRSLDGYRESTGSYLASDAGGNDYYYGVSNRYVAADNNPPQPFFPRGGQSTYIQTNGVATNVGLTGARYTRVTDGGRMSSYRFAYDTGVFGQSSRYNANTGAGAGETQWVYDINGGQQIIGFTGAGYERDEAFWGPSFEGFSRSQMIRNNSSGQAIGFSDYYAADGGFDSRHAWYWDGSQTIRIGLTDAEHTSATGKQHTFADGSSREWINKSGQAMGSSRRYSGTAENGNTTWLYGSGVHAVVGFTDAEHTRSTDGYRSSSFQSTKLTDTGYAGGISERFTAAGKDWGTSAWVTDGATTTQVGLTDAEHTQSVYVFVPSPPGSGLPDFELQIGTRNSSVKNVFEDGQAVGYSGRDTAVGGGNSLWHYNGSTSTRIGLLDAEHTDASGRQRLDYENAFNVDNGNTIIGNAARYTAGGAANGQSIWAYNGISTQNIGLTDAEHTRGTDGYRYSDHKRLNEMGEAVGIAYRYGIGGTDMGRSAWYYDGTTTVALDFLSQRSDGYAWASANLIYDSGLVLGSYKKYDESDALLGTFLFGFTEDDGVFDLNMLIDSSFDEQLWDYLAVAYFSDDQAFFSGSGIKLDGTQMGYVATAVPVPAAVWLFGSALAGLGWLRRRAQINQAAQIAALQ